jgi:flagellar hook-associated protein 1 FlgK
MSLNHILSTATSGLNASQAALRSISNNIANVNTPGYARERAELEALVAGGVGNGVRVSGVERITNRFLEAAAYAAHGDAGRYKVQQAYLDRLIAEFGAPGSETGLAGRINALTSAAIALTSDPADLTARRAFLDRASGAIREIQRLAAATASQRAEAESEVASSIDRINVLLKRVETLNASIAAAGFAGTSTASLAGQRAQALNELGEFVAIDVREQPTGAVEVTTKTGIVLVDRHARQLAYTSPPAVAGLAAYPPISVVRADGEPTGEVLTLANVGGKLGGLLDLRDRQLPATEAELATLFAEIAGTLNAASNAGSAVPAPNALNGRNTGLVAADRAGFNGRAIFAVTDASGTVVARTTVDLSATATVGDIITAINAGLGGAATASFSGGRLQLTAANPANGVVVADDPASPTARGGIGFAHYFGLNDIITAAALVPSGLIASDAHGFSTGETAGFQLRDASGRVIASASLSPVSGGTVSDLLAVLNASAIGAHGSFALSPQGVLAFTPGPSAPGATLALVSDSTDRAGTGVSLGQLLQVPPAANAALAGATVLADARRLPLARFDTSAAVGQPALFAADTRGANALASALGSGGASARVADLVARVGADARSAADAAADAGARRDDAVARRDDFSGVNLDEELAQMIVFQNSYSAAARLITAAREMYDILLRLGE